MSISPTIRTVLILAALTLLAAGCGDGNRTAFSPLEAPLTATVATDSPTGCGDPDLHQALDAMWHSDEGVLFQVFRQTIDCEVGGVFTAHPAGWPEGYDITLTVDAGTVPLNRANPVDFVMEIPVTGPVTAAALPFEFHPDGIQFNQPVHIEIVWPDWAGTRPTSGMSLWYLEQETHDGDVHYRVVEKKADELVAKNDDPLPRARFSIDHFSRWAAASPDTMDKAWSPRLDPLATAIAGAGCWTKTVPEPDVAIGVAN